MALPPVERDRPKIPGQSETHPYIINMEIKLAKMRQLMNIFKIADTNMIITDAKSGLNDYTMKHAFGDELDNISKAVIGLSKCLMEKATGIRAQVDRALDDKLRFEDVSFICDVTNQISVMLQIKWRSVNWQKNRTPQKLGISN